MIFLGIDVGGTASRWVAVDREGAEVERGSVGGATGHLFNPRERERFAGIIAGIAAEVSGVGGVHMGVTGLGPRASAEAHAIAAAAFQVAGATVSSSDDMELAFRATFQPGGGHLVSAGTGSIGLHVTADGEVIRVGGRGLLIDDGGSGTWIALTAIDRLYRQIDATGGAGDTAAFAEHLYAAVGGSAWDDVRAAIYGRDRGSIGELAQVVAAAAEVGDPLAQDVLQDAVIELARLAKALIGRTRSLPVAFVGGVIGLHPMIAEGLVAALPETVVSFPKIDAARHAAHMARARATEE